MNGFPADIDYGERGSGPAVLLVPGSFGTGAGWRAVADRLAERHRVIVTSLLGFGGTEERRCSGDNSMGEQTAVFDAIFARIVAPVHVAAHSFGCIAALAHALDGRQKPVSLVLVEPNPFALLDLAGEEAGYRAFCATMDAYLADFAAGEREAARHVIDFYGGAGSFDALPGRVRDFVIATTPTNVRDWGSAKAFRPGVSDYGSIGSPTLIVRGGKSHPAMVRLAALLAGHLPQARSSEIAEGGHFLPSTHPDELAELIAAHVASAG